MRSTAHTLYDGHLVPSSIHYSVQNGSARTSTACCLFIARRTRSFLILPSCPKCSNTIPIVCCRNCRPCINSGLNIFVRDLLTTWLVSRKTSARCHNAIYRRKPIEAGNFVVIWIVKNGLAKADFALPTAAGDDAKPPTVLNLPKAKAFATPVEGESDVPRRDARVRSSVQVFATSICPTRTSKVGPVPDRTVSINLMATHGHLCRTTHIAYVPTASRIRIPIVRLIYTLRMSPLVRRRLTSRSQFTRLCRRFYIPNTCRMYRRFFDTSYHTRQTKN